MKALNSDSVPGAASGSWGGMAGKEERDITNL